MSNNTNDTIRTITVCATLIIIFGSMGYCSIQKAKYNQPVVQVVGQFEI